MSNIISVFKLAQTFYIEKSVVKNAAKIGLTGVDLFFKSKPIVDALSTPLSGIDLPGVDVFICEVKDNDVPNVDKVLAYGDSRREYDEIVLSSDASSPTRFNFERPVIVATDKAYAIIVKVDGGDQGFALWTSVEGDTLVGTVDRVAGPAGQYIGKYFDYVQAATNSSTNWLPLNNTDLKFNVYCARYQFDEEIAEPFYGTSSYLLPKKPYEFMTFDKKSSYNASNVAVGEMAWQNSVIQPFTVSVRSDSETITTSNGNFNSLYSSSSADDQYIVVYSGSSRAIRRVDQIMSDTSIVVDKAFPFTNTAATVSKAPAGVIKMVSDASMFGRTESFIVLDESNANSNLRFCNNVIEAITINSGGSGYSNSDIVVIYGGAIGGSNSEVNGAASLTTNSVGGIVSTRISNAGIGFLSTPQYAIQNSTGGSSVGTSANLTFTVGSSLLTEFSNATFSDIKLINIGMNGVSVGAIDFDNPSGTAYDLKLSHLYFGSGDNIVDVAIIDGGTLYANNERFTVTGSPAGTGAAGYLKTDSSGKIIDFVMQSGGNNYTQHANVVITTAAGTGANVEAVIGTFRYTSNSAGSFSDRYVSLLERHNLPYTNTPQVMSRSYEVTQANSTYTTATGATVNTNISSLVELVVTSNNEFTSPEILDGELTVDYEKYSINNTYKNEHIGNGEAASKHVSTKINFADDRTAEDIRVYVRAYKPVGTDIVVYARIHNTKDTEAFDDKNWTMLECKTNSGVFSNVGDESDFIEYTYGFQQYPNTSFTAAGVVSTTLSSAVVTGSNTNFQSGTNSFAVNDVVKIYSPLFPDNYTVGVVSSISSNTSMTLTGAISNNNVVGSGLKIDKIGYPNQAFNNGENGNVVRYYNSVLSQFDGYNTFAIKIVFLSSTTGIVPKLDDTRGVGVTV